jgi:hypothetical protein
MPVFYGAVDLGKNELRNAVVQNLGAAPSSPTKGLLWFDSTNNILKWYDGTTWQSAMSGSTPPATASALGTIQLAGDLAGTATAPVIAPNAVTSAKIADGTVQAVDIAAGVIPTALPPNGAAGGDLAGSTYPNPVIANGTVTSAKILDGTVVVADTATAFDLGALASAHPTTTDVAMNTHKITGLMTPTLSNDAATKGYADSVAQGLDAKQSVHAATVGANITLAGGTPNTLDGVALAVNDRVLVKDQTAPAQNGIYTVGTLGSGANGTWQRSGDMNQWTLVPSAFTFVEQGTVNADTGWVCTSDQGGTLDTTAITWVQFSGAGQVIAGAGLTKTGNTIDAVAADTTLTVAADSIAVNTAVIATQAFVNSAIAGMPKKFAAALAGTASPEVVTHNLNTRDIQLTVLNGASPYTAVEVDWDATSATTATIRYNPNLGAGYRVVIVG